MLLLTSIDVEKPEDDTQEGYSNATIIHLPRSKMVAIELSLPINEYFLDFEGEFMVITIDLLSNSHSFKKRIQWEGKISIKDDFCYLNDDLLYKRFRELGSQKILMKIDRDLDKSAGELRYEGYIPELSNPKSSIWFDKPASTWVEGLPVGNGHLGAMVYGKTNIETIQLNEDTIWYGGPENRLNPNARENIPKVRQLLMNKKFIEASKLSELALYSCPPTQHPYQKLEDMRIEFLGKANCSTPKDYERHLDLVTGIIGVGYTKKQTRFTREIFCSYPDNVIVCNFKQLPLENESDVKPIPLSIKIRLERMLEVGNAFLDLSDQRTGNIISYYGQSGPNGVHYRIAIKPIVSNGTIKLMGEHIIIENSTEITLLISAETCYRHDSADLAAITDEIVELAAGKGFEELKQRHVKDHSNLMNRTQLEFYHDNDDLWKIPVNKRLERLKKTSQDNDLDLISLYFQFGRYLLVGSSRPGSLPANLQGLWCNQYAPSWGSKYTININTEMNYWLTGPCNLSELQLPLFKLLQLAEKHGRKTAQKMYGCRGWVAHHNINSWGDTAPVDRWEGCIWPMGAAWLSTHCWEHYLFTNDKKFLQDIGYPLMKGAAEFFIDYLIPGDDGTWLCGPSVSPENSFITKDGTISKQTMRATMDRQILYYLFTACIDASKKLGIDNNFRKILQKYLAKLPAHKIGKNGQLQEWGEDYEENEPGHRHMSHLWGLHPGNEISPEKTPDLANASKITLFRRLSAGGGHTGWSCAWIINFWARLQEPIYASEYLHVLLTKSTLPNQIGRAHV